MSLARQTITTSRVLALGFILLSPFVLGAEIHPPRPAPDFTQNRAEAWINAPPQSLVDYRGQVVVLDVWTFDCWNCYRSIPWLKAVQARYASRGLRWIGIHSPEFRHEHRRENVVAKVKEFGLGHPVMMDNDFAYWKALNNRYWPTFYLIDKQGQLRARFIGETHAGDARALRIERRIEALLAEPEG